MQNNTAFQHFNHLTITKWQQTAYMWKAPTDELVGIVSSLLGYQLIIMAIVFSHATMIVAAYR